MPSLPERPSLENLRKQSKLLLMSARSSDQAALNRVGPYFGDPRQITLQEAQLVVAREHGFPSWARLEQHVASGAGPVDPMDGLANRFLDLVCVHYGPDPNRGPEAFAQAADLVADHPDIAQHSIHTAAASGDEDAVRSWVSQDPDLAKARGGPFQWPALLYAAYARLPGRSSWPAARVLLEAGADPNAFYMWNGQYRFTALTGVFGRGEGGSVRQPEHPDMMMFARSLLEAGAHPNDSQAAYNRCFEPDDTCLKLLLAYGLKDHHRNNWWEDDAEAKTPNKNRTMHFQLMIAMRFGFAERARLLIENGVDLDLVDTTYDTMTKGLAPYQCAQVRGMPEIAALIEERGGVAEALEGRGALQAACMAGDSQTAGALAADHLRDVSGEATEMLCDAAETGNLPALRTMIALGFDLNPRDQQTPLHVAAYKGQIAAMQLLLDAGANSTIRDPVHLSAPLGHALHARNAGAAALLQDYPMDIFLAAAKGRPERLTQMLGEDPSLLDITFGEILPPGSKDVPNAWATPLWFAVVNGRLDNTRCLLAHGADPARGDGEAVTILSTARDTGQAALIGLIENALP